MRLLDINLLDMLIGKTTEITLEKQLIKSKSIIVDATHTKARYNRKSPKEFLSVKCKLLRKATYQIDEKMKEMFPKKPTSSELDDELAYCQEVIQVVENEETLSSYPNAMEKLNYC